jgi:hypothetical protein
MGRNGLVPIIAFYSPAGGSSPPSITPAGTPLPITTGQDRSSSDTSNPIGQSLFIEQGGCTEDRLWVQGYEMAGDIQVLGT